MSYNDYIKGIKRLIFEKNKRNSKKPKIYVEIAYTQKNIFKKLFGFNIIKDEIDQKAEDIQKIIKYFGADVDIKKIKFLNEYKIEIFPTTFIRMKLIHPWREIYKKRHKVNYFKCFKPYDHFVITWNGDVAVCCSDYENKSSLGNVFNDGFRKILLGKRMREFQESLKTFKVKEGICSTCKGRDNFLENLIYENYCKILYIKNMFLSLKNK